MSNGPGLLPCLRTSCCLHRLWVYRMKRKPSVAGVELACCGASAASLAVGLQHSRSVADICQWMTPDQAWSHGTLMSVSGCVGCAHQCTPFGKDTCISVHQHHRISQASSHGAAARHQAVQVVSHSSTPLCLGLSAPLYQGTVAWPALLLCRAAQSPCLHTSHPACTTAASRRCWGRQELKQTHRSWQHACC